CSPKARLRRLRRTSGCARSTSAKAAMAELLRLENLRAGYGEAVVLDGISLEVEAGDSVAILGRNGMGKTTLLNTIMGLTSLHAGRVHWQGEDISHTSAHLRAHAGLGW